MNFIYNIFIKFRKIITKSTYNFSKLIKKFSPPIHSKVFNYVSGPPYALSQWGSKNVSKRGNFKVVCSNLIYNKIQAIIQDNKITYYKIKGFFTINHWRSIVPFIHFINFKGMLRRNIQHFLKSRIYERLGFSEIK